MEENTKNQIRHIQALFMTKLGDGLVDPKLVLAWLMTTLGAGAGFVGFLVPLREAGALLPQLFTASRLQKVEMRKWWWVVGSFIQGLAVFFIALTALFFEGDIAGILILIAVGVFALARSICSVSYKDVLGKTVIKERRGRVTGTASSIAATGVLIFGLLLFFDFFDRWTLVISALLLSSLLWFMAAMSFTKLEEKPSEIAVSTKEQVFKKYIRYLLEDKELQKFLVVRALLTATAVAPPFLILLANTSDDSVIVQLGALIIASSFSTFVSGRLWGVLSDHSTVIVLSVSGLIAAALLFVSVLALNTSLYNSAWFLPVLLFIFMTCYQGVRTARTIHLVNLAHEETRAAYTAISNTIIGVVLLATGLFGILAEVTSLGLTVMLMACMSLLGGLLAMTLKTP